MRTILEIPAAIRSDRPNPASRKKPADSVSFAKHLAASRESLAANTRVKFPFQPGPVLGPGLALAKSRPSVAAVAAGAPAAVGASPAAAAVPLGRPDVSLLAPDGYPSSLLFYGALGLDTVAPPPPPPPLPTSVDTYWDMQPPAVRVLRDLQPEARFDEAEKLRAQGYLVDYPIMVLGWGPLKTMLARHNAGYTWVPSFMQTVTQVIPGMSFPGVPTYDPNNPPPGSIKVTINFARGTSDGPAITEAWGVKLPETPAT